MEVRKDFAKRTKALAESTPREAIENLLRALLPPEPVRVRSYAPATPDWAQDDKRQLPRDPVRRDPFVSPTMFKKLKTRRPKSRAYKVLNPTGYCNHRYGTWRASMVEAIVRSTNELEAVAYLADKYPSVADKGVDLAFAESVGYITFDLN
jgi:hypothetical protein